MAENAKNEESRELQAFRSTIRGWTAEELCDSICNCHDYLKGLPPEERRKLEIGEAQLEAMEEEWDRRFPRGWAPPVRWNELGGAPEED
jgi:hypothetical protein